jgi:molybdopterin-binding protein
MGSGATSIATADTQDIWPLQDMQGYSVCGSLQILGSTSTESHNVRLSPAGRLCIVIGMILSARNQLRGRVKDVKLGSVMAHIVVQAGENEIESIITRRSAEEMNLQAGDAVTVVIKSTEVMIQK